MRYLAYTWNLPNRPRSRGGRCLHPPALSGPSQGSQAPDLQGPAGDARLSSAGPILPSLPWIGLNMPSHSRDAWRPKFCISLALLKRRGRGEDRVRAAPAVSQAIVHQKMRPRAYRFSGEHPAFPAQWPYGLYEFALVTGFLATIIGRDFRLRQLDASTGTSGPHDFAVRVCRARQSQPSRPSHPTARS
jgi:hypothetical protein